MAKREEAFYNIYESFLLLNEQDREWGRIINSTQVKDHILSLRLGLLFLRTFLRISTNEELKIRIQYTVCDVREELSSLSKGLMHYLDIAYSNLRAKMMNVIIKQEKSPIFDVASKTIQVSGKLDGMKSVIFEPKTREYNVIFPKIFPWNGFLEATNDFLLTRLGNLSSFKADQIAPVMKEIEDLKEKLTHLKALLAYLAGNGMYLTLENRRHLASIAAIIDKASCLLYICSVDKMDEEMTAVMKKKLSDLLEMIKVKEIYIELLRVQTLHGSKDESFCLLENLVRLLDCNIYLNRPSAELHHKLKGLRSFLADLPYKQRIRKFNCLVKSIEVLATKAVPLLYTCHDKNMKQLMVAEVNGTLSEVYDQIEDILTEARLRTNEESYRADAHDGSKASSHVTFAPTDCVVGFKDEAGKIMDYLVGGKQRLDVISIVGMPGLGKSTLAKKIYEDPSIVDYFHVRAWCFVSQVYQKEELFLAILGHLTEDTSGMKRLNDIELSAKIFQCLKGRRYLIVIDDLWEIKAWNDLERSLPNDNNGSRILITSRVQKVVSQTKIGCKVHALREFSADESRELFWKKLIHKAILTQEFRDVGQQIALSCKGLPLAIVVIAGFLAKLEMDITKWKQIAESLSTHVLSDSESQCMAILEMSYNHLSDPLKSCFLYFGAFAEDEEISIRKLKWLWISEGFIGNTKPKSLEDVAEDFLMDLMSRSLVIAVKERSAGGVKSCRIHDLLRDFCSKKAKEESFLELIHVDGSSTSLKVDGGSQLNIYSSGNKLVKSKHFTCSVSSLLKTATEIQDGCLDITFISYNFKLLTVLELASINIDGSFASIALLIHLSYLAITSETTSIPSSIANLWKLQFCLFRANTLHGNTVVNVPDSLWDMVYLRHVHIDHRASFNVYSDRLEKSSLLKNLKTLSTPLLSYGEDAENLLRSLPTLVKLKCVFQQYSDGRGRCRFPVLGFLNELATLNVLFKSCFRLGKRYEYSFPSNLQKLTLSNFLPPWDDISKIGNSLPKLKVLKLTGRACSKQWIVNDGDFPRLTYLKLRLHNFSEWIASSDSFPVLERLLVDSCYELKEIPCDFGEIPTLRMITVRRCRPSVDNSAREIQREQQEEMLNEDLKIYIYPRKPRLRKNMERVNMSRAKR